MNFDRQAAYPISVVKVCYVFYRSASRSVTEVSQNFLDIMGHRRRSPVFLGGGSDKNFRNYTFRTSQEQLIFPAEGKNTVYSFNRARHLGPTGGSKYCNYCQLYYMLLSHQQSSITSIVCSLNNPLGRKTSLIYFSVPLD